MITKLVVDGVLYIVSIWKYDNQSRRTAKVYDPRQSTPEKVLEEIETNVFLDQEYNKKYILTPLGMSPVL